jgi:hypothetical protein
MNNKIGEVTEAITAAVNSLTIDLAKIEVQSSNYQNGIDAHGKSKDNLLQISESNNQRTCFLCGSFTGMYETIYIYLKQSFLNNLLIEFFNNRILILKRQAVRSVVQPAVCIISANIDLAQVRNVYFGWYKVKTSIGKRMKFS